MSTATESMIEPLTGNPADGPADTANTDTLIAALRSRIDDVDRALLSLLQERRALSRRVQDARIASGGVRVELARERQIVDTYRGALGTQGVALATALLRTCRGPL